MMTEKRDSMQSMKKRNRGRGILCLLLGFLAPALIALAGYILIRVWPFGDGTVLIIDSLHQYLPFYTELHEKIRAGESLLYDFSAGFGYNFWATIAYYMASPLNILIALVPTANVADFMDYMILFKIGLCGGILSWYLWKRRPEGIFLPVVFGTMYAMSNFIIGYYFNLMWIDSIAVLPLIMYGIEKIASGKGGRLYGFSLFYALWCNYYIGFMLCIFSVLYFFMSISEREQIRLRQIAARAVRFGWYSLLSGGMSAVMLLPAYSSLSASESMQGNSFPSVIKFYVSFFELMASHFAAQHPINISDTQVGLNAYCGTAVLFLVLLFVLERAVPVRKKAGRLLLTGLLLLSFSLNILNYVWHGFHQQNGLPNRFAFLYIVMLLVMAFDECAYLRSTNIWKILLCGVISTGFSLMLIGMELPDAADYGNWIYLTPLLLAVYTVVLLLQALPAVPARAGSLILGCLLFAEAAVHGLYGYHYNDNVTRSIYLKDQASYKTMVSAKDTEGFFRSEYDSQRMRNVAMYAGANSTIMFNSTMYSSITEFCDRIGMEARTNKNGYIGMTSLMNDVFGIRYVLSSIGKGDTLYQFEKQDSDGNLSLYRNDNELPIGFLVKPELRFWDISSGTPAEVQNSFVELATGLDGIFVLDRTIEAENEENYDVKIPDGKQVYLYLPSRVSSIRVSSPDYEKSFTTYTDHMYAMNSLGASNIGSFRVTLKDKQKSQPVQIYTCPDAAEEEVIRTLAECALSDARVRGNKLTGTLNAAYDGILFLSVPYDTGWRIQVDGKSAGAIRIADTFLGVEVSEGEHTISMRYVPGGFYAGLLLTLLCVLLYMGTAVLEIRSERKEYKNMQIRFSRKSRELGAGIFARLDDKKEEMRRQGRTIYNLSVGTPDFQTPQAIMDAVSRAAQDPDNYRYSLRDIPELKSALARYYRRRYQVELADDEMMSIYGSQEGMAHIAWALCDPGDLVLVPNPGYPIFKIGPELCGCRIWEYPLLEENDYLPDLDSIPEDIRSLAKFMVVSYPNNPVCRCAPDSFYTKLIRFAKENSIVIVHDNAYSDIVFSEQKGRSFLSFPGAREVGVEFYSLSKSFDYTGARMSFAVGNRDIIAKFRAIRSQIDYGIFLPVQYGAIAALEEPEDAVLAQCAEYEKRSRTLCEGLRSIGWYVPDCDGTMFVWAPLPEGYKNSETFALTLIDKAGVICTPGVSFGSLGEGYVRFALVLPPEELISAVEAIRESGIIHSSSQDTRDLSQERNA